MTWIIGGVMVDSIVGTNNNLIAAGMPVSQGRIDAIEGWKLIWNAVPIVGFFISTVWFMREQLMKTPETV